jgi:hypothetical protein
MVALFSLDNYEKITLAVTNNIFDRFGGWDPSYQ